MIFTYLNEQFESLAADTGIPVDQIRLVTGLIAVLPLGWIFNYIKGPWFRHLVGIVLGLFLEYMVYGNGIVSMLIQTVLTYVMAANIKKCGKLIFAQNLIFMSAHHIYRQITDYGGWTLDITTILMMAICKFTSFGYCVEDGRKDEKQLTPDQKLRRIEKMPHFLEFFSYIHFFGSAIVGPAFDFYDFRIFINQSNEMKRIPIGGVIKESLKQLGLGLLYSAGSVVLGGKFDLFFISTEEFGQYNWFYKFFWFNIVVTLYRLKYYGGWSMAQAGLCSTGLCYNGVGEGKDNKGKHLFNRVESCHPLKVELTHEIKTKVAFWNMSVQKWLERYVYLRIYPNDKLRASKGLQTKAQYLTLLVSAFWHGFYPGYYTSFFQWGMMITINKMTWKWATNYPENFKKIEKAITFPVYWAIRFIFFNGLFNYFGCGFQILSLEHNWNFYTNLCFVPNIVVFALTAFLLITNIGQKPPKSVTPTPGEDTKKTQ